MLPFLCSLLRSLELLSSYLVRNTQDTHRTFPLHINSHNMNCVLTLITQHIANSGRVNGNDVMFYPLDLKDEVKNIDS